MKSTIEKLQKLRDIAILTKDPLQFNLTSLIIDLQYGTLEEKDELITNDAKELTL